MSGPYRNLTHKGVAALKWVSTFCGHTKYALKTDDDVFVNMFIVLKHLRDLYVSNFTRQLMICYLYERMPVYRDGKWAVSHNDYAADRYPPYCSGQGIIFSGDVVVALHRISYFVPFFWVDDVYISCLLPQALGWNSSSIHFDMKFSYCADHEMAVYYHPTEWCKYAFTHLRTGGDWTPTWERLAAMARERAIPTPRRIRPGHLTDEEFIPKNVLFPERYTKKKER